jgi:hypothetical protein
MSRPQFAKRTYGLMAEVIRYLIEDGEDPLSFLSASSAAGGRLQREKRAALRRMREDHSRIELSDARKIAIEYALWKLSERPSPFSRFAEIAGFTTEQMAREFAGARGPYDETPLTLAMMYEGRMVDSIRQLAAADPELREVIRETSLGRALPRE